jgi:hypothetical protein
MGTIKRRGTLLLLVVLPDGSRSLIPASWTDWTAANGGLQSRCETEQRDSCLAPLSDLLHARGIVAPLGIEAALAAAERIEADHDGALAQWRLAVERTSYETQRAERRYRAVDPDNRLVAGGLEAK